MNQASVDAWALAAALPATAMLPSGASWRLEGRLVEASNMVLRLAAVDGPDESGSVADEAVPISPNAVRAVFKPRAGERPLSDFPPGTLAHREVATFIVAAAAGWSCVPETRWHEGPWGEGSMQRWVGPLEPEEQGQVELLLAEDVDATHVPIAAFDSDEGTLVLVHVDSPALREIALLDAVTNNADRKGSHLVETDDGLFAIDHGLTFHVEDKLRTVLWGFAGDALTHREREALERLSRCRDRLVVALTPHLSADEVDAFLARLDALRTAGAFPEPPDDRYGLPWPPV